MSGIKEVVAYNPKNNMITIDDRELEDTPTIRYKIKENKYAYHYTTNQVNHTIKQIRYYEHFLQNIYDYLPREVFNTLKTLSQNRYLEEEAEIINLCDFGVEIIEKKVE